jgi:hypothetical protein
MDAVGNRVIARHAQRHRQRLIISGHHVSALQAIPNKWRLWAFDARE